MHLVCSRLFVELYPHNSVAVHADLYIVTQIFTVNLKNLSFMHVYNPNMYICFITCRYNFFHISAANTLHLKPFWKFLTVLLNFKKKRKAKTVCQS